MRSRFWNGLSAALASAIVVASPGALSGAGADEGPGTVDPPQLAEESPPSRRFPFRVVITRSASLFHWVDSISDRSGGKTVGTYQRHYRARIGRPTDEDRAWIGRFRAVRDAHAGTLVPAGEGRKPIPRGFAAMLQVFLEEPDVSSALKRLGPELDERQLDALRGTLAHFGPRFDAIWSGSQGLTPFVAELDGGLVRQRLDNLLLHVARFFGVSAPKMEVPRLVLVPLPRNEGTHAQAVGINLLLEIPPGDGLADQASVVAHETSHFLFAAMGRDALARLESIARARGARGLRAWTLLSEALPTAIGQGEIDRAFRPQSWSPVMPWYHRKDVDLYAKEIHPLVVRSLERGDGRFDEEFLNEAIDLLPARLVPFEDGSSSKDR